MRVLALAIAAVAIGRSAAAQDLMIALDKTALVAPATVTVSAESLSEDPILSYHWTGLPNAPRCRDARCEISIPVASCTSISLEAVNVFGETVTATRAVCANDQQGGEPPRLEMTVIAGSALTTIHGGSNAIEIMRGWVDGVQTEGDPLHLAFENTGGCHALDVFVADSAGRIAVAQKTYCYDEDAPKLWMGGKPSAFLPVGEELERCAESAHPLGLPVRKTGGDTELGRCGPSREAPRSIEHVVVAGTDSREVQSFASAFFAATPSSGAPVLFFADVQSSIAVQQFKELRFGVSLYGGSGPYTVSGVPGLEIGDTQLDRVALSIDRVSFPAGETTLSFTLRDSRGLEARVSTILTVQANLQDGPHAVQADRGAACRCVGAVSSAPWPQLLLALVFAFVLRRRR